MMVTIEILMILTTNQDFPNLVLACPCKTCSCFYFLELECSLPICSFTRDFKWYEEWLKVQFPN